MSTSIILNPNPQQWENLYCNSITSNINITTAVTGTATLTATNTSINVSNAGSAYNIILPAPINGAFIKFTVVSTLNAAVTLKSPSANITGSLLSSDGTAVTNGAITSAKTNIILGTGAVVGDQYTFTSDGNNYFLIGVTALHTSVTQS